MKFSFIGFGNLGQAFAQALLSSNSTSSKDIFIYDSSPEVHAIAGANPFNVNIVNDINEVISCGDVIVLMLKGYVFQELAPEINRLLLSGKTVISCMAGESFGSIEALIGPTNLVRAMPTLAIALLEGVIGYTKAPPELVQIFDKFGYARETTPENMDKFMAFAACGLGYAAYLIDTFAMAGEDMGFTPEEAAEIAGLTFKNAVDRKNFKATANAVATPGGATEQGINYLNEFDVYDIVAKAVLKGYERYTQ